MEENSVYPDLYDATIAGLNKGLESGLFASVDLTKAYLARIGEVNSELHAVIETNPNVLEQAASLDEERRKTGPRGPLHGIPILVKDNIATGPADGMQTTAGSFALLDAFPSRAAHTVQLLIEAGALILGKANLSEWANFRGIQPSGWSARGGQCLNPYLRRGDPGGSSSGSGVAAAVGLAAACVGTETDGSIISPSRRNNIVGLKPTVGLTSRAGVVPISATQDSIGPMARCVADAAVLLAAISGPDVRDPVTSGQPVPVPNYMAALRDDALRGARIGVPRTLIPRADKLDTVMATFEDALSTMRALGAEIIDDVEMPSAAVIADEERQGMLVSEKRVVETEFLFGLEAYIAELPGVPTGVLNVEDLIAFNEAHADQELIPPHYASQTRLIASKELAMDTEYRAALDENHRLGRTNGIDAVIGTYRLDALVLPADAKSSTIAAIAGYPIISVPLGFRPDTDSPTPADPIVSRGPGLPFGLAFLGTAWSESQLLAYAYAFEQATKVRAKGRCYDAALPKTQLIDVIEK